VRCETRSHVEVQLDHNGCKNNVLVRLDLKQKCAPSRLYVILIEESDCLEKSHNKLFVIWSNINGRGTLRF
jgi:hypothetical protein